jgi:hypothetical protein
VADRRAPCARPGSTIDDRLLQRIVAEAASLLGKWLDVGSLQHGVVRYRLIDSALNGEDHEIRWYSDALQQLGEMLSDNGRLREALDLFSTLPRDYKPFNHKL